MDSITLALMLIAAAVADEKLQAKEVRYSPFNAVQFAELDAAAIANLQDGVLDPSHIRYLSLHNLPKEDRKNAKAVTDKTLNSLNSQYRQIKRTPVIPANSDDPIVIRVNLKDYGISPRAWDYLADNGSGPVPIPDPYFHYKAVKHVNSTVKYKEEEYEETVKETIGHEPGTNKPVTQDKKVKKIRKVPIYSDTEETVYSTAPWLAIEQDEKLRGATMANLVKITNTQNPILRADWFNAYATWAPAYYELIGLTLKPNPEKDDDAKKRPKVYLEDDFNKLVKLDEKVALQEIVAAVADTKLVTLHNRILQRFTTPVGTLGGSYWRSQDTDTGIDDEDYLNNIATFDTPKIKAQEVIATGRNGLHLYMLTDNKKRILDVAVANIAQHSDIMPTKLQDKQIWAGRNCMLCHASGQNYIKDKVRTIAQGRIGLFITDKAKDRVLAVKIEEAFSPDIKAIVDNDNAKYAAAVLAATGLEAKTVGRLFEDVIVEYLDKPVNLEKMARAAGFEDAKLDEMLREGTNLDYTLVSALQNPPEDISRIPWERQGYSALMQYVLSYMLKDKPKTKEPASKDIE